MALSSQKESHEFVEEKGIQSDTRLERISPFLTEESSVETL